MTSDSDISVTDDTEVPKKGSKRKKCKSPKPTVDVLTVLNIVDRTKNIKNEICSRLSKKVSDFSQITAQQIADCGPYKKTNIAEHLLLLIGKCDELQCHTIELSSPSTLSSPTVDFSTFESNISDTLSKHMEELNKSNNFAFEAIQDQVKRLEELIPKTASSMPPHVSHQNAQKPSSPATKLNIDPYTELIPKFVTEDNPKSALYNYLSSESNKFSYEGERSILYYGEHDYLYSGIIHHAKEPPEIIGSIMSKINETYPNKKVNSCLVTRYVSGEEHCPPHSDDEGEIAPESNIYTLSIGAERHMVFESIDNADNNKTELILPHGSLLVFSRLSQAAFKHSIPVDTTITNTRFSLTFRSIAPYNVNSTVILGDSNTKYFNFGDSPKESFGKWMPGKLIKCSRIESIPPPSDIGSYKNIVIHTGINDVKFSSPSCIPDTLKLLERKCKAIIDVFPSSNVYVCPLLPTKDHRKNTNVVNMNMGITELSEKYSNIKLMSNYYELFSNPHGLMKPALGRFQSGQLSDDDIHLGRLGIKLLVKCLKHCILKQKGPILKYSDYIANNINSNVDISKSRQRSGVNRSSQSDNYARALTNRTQS